MESLIAPNRLVSLILKNIPAGLNFESNSIQNRNDAIAFSKHYRRFQSIKSSMEVLSEAKTNLKATQSGMLSELSRMTMDFSSN